MKLALIGYGKMGREIERIAISRNHTVVLKISSSNQHELKEVNLKSADAAIEFTTPDAASDHIIKCFLAGIPIIAGTTGWHDRLDHIKQECMRLKGALLYASNFSVGANIFFEINKLLASLMKNYPEYNLEIEETHHLQKLDKPSGTAITLANDIIETNPKKKMWTIRESELNKKEKIFIRSVRKENVVGIHQVQYQSETDCIRISHEAFSRSGFALGAVMAAEWMAGKKGVFTMSDMLQALT